MEGSRLLPRRSLVRLDETPVFLDPVSQAGEADLRDISLSVHVACPHTHGTLRLEVASLATPNGVPSHMPERLGEETTFTRVRTHGFTSG